jgi:hypothetical protein
MDALIKAALDGVNEAVNNIPDLRTSYRGKYAMVTQDRTEHIKDAVRAVDALRSALKTLKPNGPPSRVSE